MNPFKELLKNLENLKENTEASFTGIFINTKPFLVISDYEEAKKSNIEEKLSHLIEKSLEIEEVMEGFGKKYTYAEGEEIAIFIFYINEIITMGTIIEKKPRFALILLEHEIMSNKLKEKPDFLKELSMLDVENISIEELLKDSEETLETQEVEQEEKEEEKTEIYVEKDDTIEEVPSLEDLIQESIEEYKKLHQEEKELEKKVKEERSSDYVDPVVLEHIEKEFVKEIGPIAKLIFNRKVSELNINPKQLKTEDIVLLIQELAKEIRLEEKKEKFLNETNDLL